MIRRIGGFLFSGWKQKALGNCIDAKNPQKWARIDMQWPYLGHL